MVALLIWMGVHRLNPKNRFGLWVMVTLALLFIAIVGVFVDIPIVSSYAFWVLLVAYLIRVGDSEFSR
jgi:hypothetical protein